MPNNHTDKNIPLQELKGLLLDIISDLDAFCRKNGLRYALAYGSLLGTVRHKGFIPWDDDIDVLMPRPDYLRLLREYHHPYFEIQCQDKDPKYPLNFAKLCDTRTISIDSHGNKSPVAVDIFILDGLGADRDKAEAFIAKVKQKQRLWSNQLFTKNLKVGRQFNITKNIYIILAKILGIFISTDGYVKRMLAFIQRYPIDHSTYCASFIGHFLIYETEKMLACRDAEFENLILRIPVDFDYELRLNYGDYMQLPPEDQRRETHEATAYWVK